VKNHGMFGRSAVGSQKTKPWPWPKKTQEGRGKGSLGPETEEKGDRRALRWGHSNARLHDWGAVTQESYSKRRVRCQSGERTRPFRGFCDEAERPPKRGRVDLLVVRLSWIQDEILEGSETGSVYHRAMHQLRGCNDVGF